MSGDEAESNLFYRSTTPTESGVTIRDLAQRVTSEHLCHEPLFHRLYALLTIP